MLYKKAVLAFTLNGLNMRQYLPDHCRGVIYRSQTVYSRVSKPQAHKKRLSNIISIDRIDSKKEKGRLVDAFKS